MRSGGVKCGMADTWEGQTDTPGTPSTHLGWGAAPLPQPQPPTLCPPRSPGLVLGGGSRTAEHLARTVPLSPHQMPCPCTMALASGTWPRDNAPATAPLAPGVTAIRGPPPAPRGDVSPCVPPTLCAGAGTCWSHLSGRGRSHRRAGQLWQQADLLATICSCLPGPELGSQPWIH